MAPSSSSSKKKVENESNETAVGGGLPLPWMVVGLLALLGGIITEPLHRMYVKEQRPLPPSLQSFINSHSVIRQLVSTDSTETMTTTDRSYSCTEDELKDFLHPTVPMVGMHVVCLDVRTNNVTIYMESSPRQIIQEHLNKDTNNVVWSDIKTILETKIGIRAANALRQPWATFTPTGHRLLAEDSPSDASVQSLYSVGMFLIMEGGQWVWPGVEKGYIRHIQIDSTRNATLETLSLRPLVLSVDGFLSDDECDWIQQTAEPRMKFSGVTLMDKDKGRPATDFRTSETAFLTDRSAPEIVEIDRRTANLVRIPENHQEPPQVLRYVLNAKYDQHHDYFDPRLYQNDPQTLAMIDYGRKNRMATVLWYLSDVEAGGETVFPRMDGAPSVPNDEACQTGLRVQPKKGSVIIFYSLRPDGSRDSLSAHGACPVRGGVKWAANKWVRAWGLDDFVSSHRIDREKRITYIYIYCFSPTKLTFSVCSPFTVCSGVECTMADVNSDRFPY
jgi:prolyl 4-hydroxylase